MPARSPRDFRPDLDARRRYLERWGAHAAGDFISQSVTAAWRRRNVLVAARLELEGPIVDLCDPAVRREVEERHADLLARFGLDHLDFHEITTKRRPVTQTIAGDLFDSGAAAIRFPSGLDGAACVAVFGGRGEVSLAGGPVALTEPPARPLVRVCEEWGLELEPAPPIIGG